MITFTCIKGCCNLHCTDYKMMFLDYKHTRNKAGIVLYDKYTDKILLGTV